MTDGEIPDGVTKEAWDTALSLVADSEAAQVPYYAMGGEHAAARQRDAMAIAQALTAAASNMDWQPIEDCRMGTHGVILGRFVSGKMAQVVGGFIDATGVWRVLGRNGGNIKVPFTPTHYKHITWPVPKFPATSEREV